MTVNTNINHVNEYYALSPEVQREFDDAVRKELMEHPIRHIDSEWGCFQDLPQMNEEQREEVIDKLLSKMSLKQKVNQMSGDNPARYVSINPERYNFVPYFAGEDCELNIPAIKFTDGPSGIVMGYHSTAFPVSIARGASFDQDLEERIGEVMGIEGRSGGANLCAAICINVLRHPAWGRAQETYGEDPCLLGIMGSALTRGIQKHMMACVKHFACNSMENSRFKVSVDADERTMREIYLPHFKECVDEGAACVMSAYNKFRDTYCGHNDYLLNDVLKKEWGFRGFVMSDFMWGIRDTIEAANGGQCIEMDVTQYFGKKLEDAVNQGKVSEEIINDAVRRILREKIRFSYVGNKELYGEDKPGCPEHVALAREVSEKSTVLLKNEGAILPLKKEKIKNILMVGPKAVVPNIGDTVKGSSAVFPDYVVTPYQGIKNYCGSDIEVRYIDGMIKHMIKYFGAKYDVIIIVAGLDWRDEGEYDETGMKCGGDRSKLGLHEDEINMIRTANEVNDNVIVCLQGGSAIMTEEWEKNAKAILMQWYPGMEGGNALANIIFGKINPSAKLPVTIPASRQQMPFYKKETEHITYDYYHGYFLADKKEYDVSYHFGYGLSYTTFNYKNIEISKENRGVYVSCTIQNTGSMEGEEVVQLYIGYKNSSVERHIKDLKNFTKVKFKRNETKKVRLYLPYDKLKYYSVNEGRWILEDIIYLAMIGSSSRKEDLLVAEFNVSEAIEKWDIAKDS